MKHPVITLIKWLFLAIGIALLAAAVTVGSDAAVPLSILGIVFAGVGGGIVAFGWLGAKHEAELRQSGHLIQADLQQVERNESLEVNGANPFRIVAQWHDVRSNELFIFKSANLWFDPSPFVEGRKIPVFVDLGNPSRYHVDTSFLPTLRG